MSASVVWKRSLTVTMLVLKFSVCMTDLLDF